MGHYGVLPVRSRVWRLRIAEFRTRVQRRSVPARASQEALQPGS